ncbi:MAG: 4-hydroxy-3-methylbut-2-enyl diphosphate reductase [Candidatus Aureabacteria bacterium]|nr:4-hydroxy-3-methylbut-2-enyl diphosphate reductase [Candidatus Auribacterota bacterium]
MKIKLAKALGTCFGVKNALEQALHEKNKGNLTILGQLVHNPQTVEKLKAYGIAMINNISEMNKIKTKRVMITAHGVSEIIKKQLIKKGLKVEDATCPLVAKVHQTIKKMVAKGLFPVVIGHPDHVEVQGIVGDLDEYFVLFDEKDIPKLASLDKKKLGIVSQTTNRPEKMEQLVSLIKKQPGIETVEFSNTVCKPTRDRQKAAQQLAQDVDIMIVIGGYNSSNTKKLLKICEEKNVPGYHIENVSEINLDWFKEKKRIGITAGTSTPIEVIDEVYQYLHECFDK